MRCPMWGEGKRVGERRGCRVEVYKWFLIGEMRVFSFFLSSVQVVGLYIRL